MILDYHIFTSDSADLLSILVYERISDDSSWLPLGAPFEYHGKICQAMIKTERDEGP